MKIKKNQIIYIFLVFSILISFSHILIDKMFNSMNYREITLENIEEITLDKEKTIKDLLKESKSIILSTVDDKDIQVRINEELLENVFLSLIYLIITLSFSFLMIKVFVKLFYDLNKQKDAIYRLELASNIANIAIWEFNPESKEVIWTKNIKNIFQTDEDITYSDFVMAIPENERDLVESELYGSIEEKREYSIIHKITIKGNTRVLDEKGKHFYNSLGKDIKSIGCTYDITEKYYADNLKDKIIKQNKKFEILFNKFDVNVIASTTDLNGIITYTSKAFCKISGYSKSELIGSSQNIVRHPDSSPEVFKDLWKTIKSGRKWHGEIKNRNKNGLYYWVEAVIYPEYDYEGKVYGYTAVRQDITPQKELEELHKKVKSSIEVASFIQESILPMNNFMNSCFSDKFIIWEPKDIVGGDIYLFQKLRDENEYLLMVIDCTGHGVPGAFVTMLIKAIEKEIIQNFRNNPELEVNPGEVLQYFNKSIKEILKQEKRNLATNVGFDGGIFYFNKKRNIVKYSGTANTLVYYDKNEIKVIKGDRHSIGYKNIDTYHEFKNHEIKVEKGMKFYLFTDGYIDQIGGDKKQSFSKTRMINLLDKTKKETMAFQKEVLIEELKAYQENFERIDDITILGIEI